MSGIMSEVMKSAIAEHNTQDQGQDRILFSAVLRPHRSMTARNINRVLILVGLAGLFAAIPFIVFGFWPVAGFYGLDIALLFWAFHANLASAKTSESIVLSPFHLDIEKRPFRGKASVHRFNPLWTRLHKDIDEDTTVTRLALVSNGEVISIGDCLNHDDRADFGKALQQALNEAKRGPTFSPPAFPCA
jgi:uncharacterized membrane protein